MTAGRICCVCDQAIIGPARKIVRHSASGVRPDDYAHCGPCPPPEPQRSTLARYLPGRP